MMKTENTTRGMTETRNRNNENRVYVALWVMVVAVCLLNVMRGRSLAHLPLLDWNAVLRILDLLLPVVILFVVNNFLIVPRLLLRSRYLEYFCSVMLLMVGVWGIQCGYYMVGHEPSRPAPPPDLHPLMPFPLFLDMIYDILVVGVNMSVALVFQHFQDKLERERIMKSNAENQLSYLKAQINPHFYMNMLNNIHGMIEIDTEKAQEMVMDMSRLMRYTLYSSSRPRIPLRDEIGFLKDYFKVMGCRYPREKMEITLECSVSPEAGTVEVAPLIFLVFIENAFKHGVDFSRRSFVRCLLSDEAGRLEFRCVNSSCASGQPGGIGLRNVRERLRLIYGRSASLTITDSDGIFEVLLVLPKEITMYENQDGDNRR